ncbi:uncharacterized protein LOC122088713 isoform X2 [Macadamia integrifolia]|uniref:uncharacterized protein LOC122088713 isoform X2 n=1 Tax=Macadamia integrifolia TaxID=60698 RepID=UPI001C4F7715|nr:uncharacterized protein LOC122088713 isoform X2 [Macadamia integrifolia]
MSSKGDSFRAVGQRSLSSSFVFKCSSGSKDSNGDLKCKPSKQESRISFSDFLDRKLNKTPISAKTVQAKQKPFSSMLGNRDSAVPFNQPVGSLNEAIFEQFKHIRKDAKDCDDSSQRDETEESARADEQESRKRRCPFEGSYKGGLETLDTPRYMLVLGDDPKPKQNGRRQREKIIVEKEKFIVEKKPRTAYNHYANGRGWWDCDMEGIDSEEVGCNEVWEGMGSTTLGGLEWH